MTYCNKSNEVRIKQPTGLNVWLKEKLLIYLLSIKIISLNFFPESKDKVPGIRNL